MTAGRRSGIGDSGPTARERILEAAYKLFSRDGIRGVGVDRIVAESDVAKMTLYRHFASKDALVLAFLDLREERWTRAWLAGEVERLAETPAQRPLAVFDALDGWFHRSDFEGCPFIATLLEINDKTDPVHQRTVGKLDAVRTMIEGYLEEAGAPTPEETSHELRILVMGAIVAAICGDLDAAHRARRVAEVLLST